jgi:hypothetical protein
MLVSLFAAFVGCAEAPPPAEPAPAPAPAAEPPAPTAAEDWKVLQASPLSLEGQVRSAGVAESLEDLVPKTLPAAPPPEDRDRVALRTGVIFAYTVLGGRSADKAAVVGNVQAMRDGMATIGAGQGLLGTMDKAIEQLKNDTVSRQDFLQQLDDEVASAPSEAGWGPTDSTGPMVQAGAWVAGTNLVAQAVVRKNDPAATKLLRRPEVPAYFLKYLSTAEGAEKAGPTKEKVVEALQKLQQVTQAPELTVADAQTVVDTTGALLALL